jgi:hypothetical protein
MFVCFFLLVRRQRLTALGRKIGCVTLTVAVLTFPEEMDDWLE